MTDIKDLKIHFVDCSNYACYCMENAFEGVSNIEVIHKDVKRFFFENYGNIDCLVSPANAFGIMSGGYDAALSDILGWDFQKVVQQYIKDNFYGEQVVGTSFIIKTPIPKVKLIHTPTMRYPSRIANDAIIYHCMRSTLICALKNDVKSIVIPLFGCATGGVDARIVAKRMKEAYDQILNKKWSDLLF